jgi:type IV pilus assembly protein PilW
MKTRSAKPSILGYTLIELMIAMTLGLFVIGSVIEIFINSKQTYRLQENQATLQENARFAINYLANDIRLAGNWGCLVSPTATGTTPGDISGTDQDNNLAVTGVTPLDTNNNTIDDGTDTLTLKGAFVLSVPPPNQPFPSPNQATMGPSCGTNITSTGLLNAIYTDASSTITYTVYNGILRRTTGTATGTNAQIIEGVEDMQILYGVDTDTNPATGTSTDIPSATPNYFVPASLVGANCGWDCVVSIRISLLLNSLDDNLTPTSGGSQYTFISNGVTYTSKPDKKVRHVVSTTIAVRNRIN